MLIILMVACFSGLTCTFAAKNEFQMPVNTGCACPGSTLIYNCTAVGTGTTVWEGSAFDCPEDGIILRHERFPGGISGICNGGAITGRSVEAENNCYTSQLMVAVGPAINNKTIECIYNSNLGSNKIGASRINILEAPYRPPSDIQVTVREKNITFGWSFLLPNCTFVYYNVSSDCGSCPDITSSNNVTCSNWQPSTNDPECSFSVHSVICGSDGESTNSLVVTLKVPDVPTVTVIPVYSANQSLSKVSVRITQTIPLKFTAIDDRVVVKRVSGYNVYSNSNLLTRVSSCVNDECENIITVPAMTCKTSGDIGINVSASNSLGEGQASDPSFIGCTNQFVEIEYNSDTSTISCKFLNQLENSVKSCSIRYGQCSLNNPETASVSISSNIATLEINLSGSGRTFCVVASNSTYTIMVEGRTNTVGNHHLVRIIVPIVVTLTVMIMVSFILLVIIIIWLRHHKHTRTYKGFHNKESDKSTVEMKQITDVNLLKLKCVDQSESVITRYAIENDCSIKEFCAKKGLTFKRGSIFFEFSHDKLENISKDKRLIFMQKITGKYFYPDVDDDKLCEMNLIGEKVRKPAIKDYTLFVQSTGSGSRHLAKDTLVLYEKLQPLWFVDKESYKKEEVGKNRTLGQFCGNIPLDFSKRRIYIERCCEMKKSEEDIQITMEEGSHSKPAMYENVEMGDHHDKPEAKQQPDLTEVILLDRNTNRLLISPSARPNMEDMKQWRVFVLTTFNEDLQLVKGTGILYGLHDHQQVLSESIPVVCLCSDQFQSVKLKENCDYKKFQDTHGLDSSEPNVFIEANMANLNRKERENVLDMILTDKEMNMFFSCSFTTESEELLKRETYLRQWRIFLLFSEKKRLKKDTVVLYGVNKFHWQPNGLFPIYSKRCFAKEEVKAGLSFSDFCKGKNLDSKKFDFFTELGSLPLGVDSIRDALLLDNDVLEQDHRFLTGPDARRIAKEQLSLNGVQTENLNKEQNKWKVFVLSKNLDTKQKFKKDAIVYYQKHGEDAGKFKVLKVHKDNVRMSTFVEEKLQHVGCFENGKAFYEFCADEDLPYYKEVVLLRGSKKSKPNFPEDEVVSCEFESFYKTPGTPGIGVKPQSTGSETKVFVQSFSHGSRCLKKGEFVLYKET